MLAQVIDLGHHGHAIGDQRFVFGAMAEIRAHRRFHLAHPRFERRFQARQIVHPLRVVGFLRPPRRTQTFERRRELGDVVGGLGAFRLRRFRIRIAVVAVRGGGRDAIAALTAHGRRWWPR
jgi:hypothetical protein